MATVVTVRLYARL